MAEPVRVALSASTSIAVKAAGHPRRGAGLLGLVWG